MISKYFHKAFIYFFITIFLTLRSLGAEPSEANACSTISSPNDILDCSLQRSFEARVADLEVAKAKAEKEKAGQWINPDLDAKGTYGKSLGSRLIDGEVSLLPTIPLGGRRSASIRQGKAKEDEARFNSIIAKDQTVLETGVNLLKLAQTIQMKEIYQEGLKNFQGILQKYKRRPQLSPEDQVSRDVFELVEGNYALLLSHAEEEQIELLNTLEAHTALSKEVLLKNLPDEDSLVDWPKTNDLENANHETSPYHLRADAKLKAAEANLDVAKGESWPDLKIGPTYIYSDDGDLRTHRYGLSLSLPLPIFSLNLAGREAARRERDIGMVEKEKEEVEVKSRFSQLLTRYETSVNAFQKIARVEQASRQFAQAKSLFQRGLISSSLVIESHRQLGEYLVNRHEHVVRALEALWTLYSIRGEITKARFREAKK